MSGDGVLPFFSELGKFPKQDSIVTGDFLRAASHIRPNLSASHYEVLVSDSWTQTVSVLDQLFHLKTPVAWLR